MIIYLDLIILLNLVFDFLLLLVVNITLKRNTKILRIVLGSFIGGLSILVLFIKISSAELFFLKILISILMLLVTFSFKSINYFCHNVFYLYLTSMILGGFLYFLSINFSYKNSGLIFFSKGLSVNVIFLLIFSPLILYIYIRSNKKLKNTYNEYYQVIIKFKNKRVISLTAFLDSGNKLIDPYFFNPIVLVSREALQNKIKIENVIYVPFSTVDNKSILECIRIDSLVVEGKSTKNVLLGIVKDKFNLEGISCILNPLVMEGLK